MMIFLLTMISLFCACDSRDNSINSADLEVAASVESKAVLPGAYQTEQYLPILAGQRVGLVVNHTSTLGQTHLVDSLMTLGVDIKMIFAPEHGFKGTAYNGEEIKDGLYRGSIPIRSLYGKSKKPAADDLSKVDVVIFDIQDVGARFYTYISTLHYVMEAAAESDKKVIILDRPNPNGHYVDGPVLEKGFESFVGMHPVPVVYGMTIGEYGQMINGEGWLNDGIQCNLSVVPVMHYTHATPYALPIPPSPNLPNQRSILLYPSLCFFEGTVISAGRGTDHQFQAYGHPSMTGDFIYTPVSMTSSKYPKHEGKLCKGVDLRSMSTTGLHAQKGLDLSYLLSAHTETQLSADEPFFLKSNFFEKLAGTDALRKQVMKGVSPDDIKASWQPGLAAFEEVRGKYLIYK